MVAYNFLGAAITYALTRSVTRALLFLLVDISCVLKISTPIVVMTAMRQMGDQQVLIKGGRFVEEFAQADTFVFDKTGTLTTTRPLVMDVLTFGGFSREEVIRYAACLEEHYYHPIGHAVVEQADRENIPHDEMHGELTYIVSHGIQSEIDGKRTVIGSRHFVIEDEGVPITAEQEAVIAEQAQRYNLLYFSIDQQLAGVFCIDAPLRPNARQVMDTLRAQGKHLVMLTGISRPVPGNWPPNWALRKCTVRSSLKTSTFCAAATATGPPGGHGGRRHQRQRSPARCRHCRGDG
ncbi:HAD-IC family P-type ATPase [Deinococcus malanensis]|uniref:HAD-IC family P-type ATPase n=1 Tax=Deinococcus malanensis TaxID=1706855 RepID=UPI003636E62D